MFFEVRNINYIVFDMEWNQPYSKVKKQSHGVELRGEIIQLGAVKLNDRFEISDSFKINIAPKFYKKINRHIKNITGIEDSALRDCKGFADAFCEFCEFCGNDYKLMTWGCDDMPMLRDNLTAHGLDSDKLPENFNLQMIFNAQVSHDGRQWSLEDAMQRLGIEQQLRSHDALCDAVNTAKIAKKLNIKKTIKRYAGVKFMRRGVDSVSKSGFNNLRELFCDKKLLLLECPVCNRRLRRAMWVGSRYKRYAVAHCSRHGSFKFCVSAVHDQAGGYTACRKVGYATPEAVESYNLKIKELIRT